MENLQGGTLALEHHYHLDRRVDSFGLVTVYAGTQDPFDLPVQITVYDGLVDAGADPSVTERIKTAARTASALDVRGLLSVVDFGDIEQGVPFVIEQTVRGPSLARVLESKDVLPPEQTVALVCRICDLLADAHGRGVCHGNLKPEWIALSDDDSSIEDVRLSHFGLGPAMRELVAMPQAVLTTDLVDAFAPECFEVTARDQLDEVDPDHPLPHLTPKADQWAVAALAFRLLVGIHPFFDDPVDASEGILRIKTEAPPSLAEMGVDPALAEAIDRALAPDPDDRWPAIGDFQRALRDAVDSSPADPDDVDEPADAAGDRAAPAAAPAPTPADRPDSPDISPSEPVGPRPSGYLLTVAVAALVLTNLGWFFFAMAGDGDDPGQDAAAVDESSPPEALPSGLQLQTSPSDAELFVLRDDARESLGFTPVVITDNLFEDSHTDLLLRHSDYRDQPLSIGETDVGRTLRLELIADAAGDDANADDDGDF